MTVKVRNEERLKVMERMVERMIEEVGLKECDWMQMK